MEEYRNIKLTIAYDGTAYHGFQRQANAISIQQVLEDKLARIFGHSLKISGAGRTDTGVHAYGQVVNLFTTGKIPLEKVPIAAKSVLPADIAVTKAELVSPSFHARKSALSKKYIYRIFPSETPSPFYRNYAWHLSQALDISAMHEAAQLIVGTHDFSAFRAAGGEAVHPVRTIFQTYCRQEREFIELLFWGSGFLYHMVRNLVGTLKDVGTAKITARDFARILAGRDRKQAGAIAPPQGLYLQEVLY